MRMFYWFKRTNVQTEKETKSIMNRSVGRDILSIYIPSFFIFLGIGIVSPILPLYARSFNINYTLVSLAISAYALGRFIADIPVGILADKWGRRPLMILGTLIIAITAFLNALAGSFPEFLVYRLIQGVGSAMWMTGRTALLADILKPEERGRIMSYFQAFMLLGQSAGPTIGGYVVIIWGVKATFYFYSVTAVISLLITYIWIKEPAVITHHKKQVKFNVPTVKRLLSNPSFSLACLATFTIFFMRTGIRNTLIPLYADSVLGLDTATIGTVISYATLMNLIMTVPMGHAIDYFGRKAPMVGTLFITALAALAFPFTTNYLTLSLAAVLLGIGTGGAGQAPLAMATDATVDEPHGLSMGLYRLFGDIGFVVGPIILGLIADNYNLKTPFYFMTGLILVSMVLIQLFAKETYRAKQRSMHA